MEANAIDGVKWDYYAVQVDERPPFQAIAYRWNRGDLVVLYQTPEQLERDLEVEGALMNMYEVPEFPSHYERELAGCYVDTAGGSNESIICVIESDYPEDDQHPYESWDEKEKLYGNLLPDIKVWKLEDDEIGKYVYPTSSDVPNKDWYRW